MNESNFDIYYIKYKIQYMNRDLNVRGTRKS
jgi:hypothetical protein